MQAKLTNVTVKQFEVKEKPYEVVDTDIKGFLLRVQPSGRKVFYFSYRTDGIRKRIKIGALGNVSARVARDEAEKYSANVTTGLDVQAKKKESRIKTTELRDKTLDKFLTNTYKPWVLANRKSGQHTLDLIRREFSDYNTFPLEQINVLLIDKWRTSRLKQGIKASTINRSISALRAMLSKAVEWNVLEAHPLRKLKPLKVDSSPNVRYLTPDEENRLYQALDERDQKIKNDRENGNAIRKDRGYELLPSLKEFAFADRLKPMIIISLKTGLRRGELFDLEWRDINFREKILTVRGETAKSNRTRHIPLSPIAFDVLNLWRAQQPNTSGYVFPSDDGRRLNNVKKSWQGILKKAKIGSFRWHDMRHDFASKLVMKGAPLNTVRELCGHANMNTTLRYAHLAPDHKADAISLLG
jgi:integrase